MFWEHKIIAHKAEKGLEQNGNTLPAKLLCRQLSEEHFRPLSVSERWRQLEGQNVRSVLAIMSSQLLDIFFPKGQSLLQFKLKSPIKRWPCWSPENLCTHGAFILPTPTLHLDLMITFLKNKNQLHAESAGEPVVIFCFFRPFCWSECKMGLKMEDNSHTQSMNLLPYYIQSVPPISL